MRVGLPITPEVLKAAGDGAIMAGPMGARPLMLDGGFGPQAEKPHRGVTGDGKKNHLTPRKLINRPAAGGKNE